ncbi:MAG: 3'(2'),5'-bisphosphate nucleotidase [Planctomyces sp.]|nr:3'(2'),5'-bisphosphate nucleotidase [Planctomyces sp.]
MSGLFDRELQAGLEAVRKAADVCRRVQAEITPEVLAKKDQSPVTVADFASQAIVCRHLEMMFPDDPVIGEEGAAELRAESGSAFLGQVVQHLAGVGIMGSGDDVCRWIDRGGQQEHCDRFWTLDPIDGTKGFLRREQYAISLALIVNGRIEVGILGCPNMSPNAGESGPGAGVLAWAVRTQGSWSQPLGPTTTAASRLKVTSTGNSGDARFCESVESGHSAHDWSGMIAAELGIRREPFRIDSQCKYLAVARGDADLYLRLPTKKGYVEKIWDHAGGVLVVEEAGGRVTDIHGHDVEFHHGASLKANQGMIVTNGLLHNQTIAAVMNHAPQDFRR